MDLTTEGLGSKELISIIIYLRIQHVINISKTS